ncbi:MAG: glycine zipper 2TM domain-containing protein [Novosphingobium sp.]
MSVRTLRTVILGAAALAFASPVLAQQPASLPPPPPGVPDAQGHVYDGPMPDSRPVWNGAVPTAAPIGQAGYDSPAWQQARAEWLAECRSRHGNGNRVGGAVIGGLIGGVVGNRVAGRGDRVVGTVAGAAVGAMAGGAIGDAADRRSARDYCEAYLDQALSRQQAYGQGYGQPVYGYGYAPMTVMVPVAYVQTAAPAQPRECKETVVTEEWVPVRTRYIPPRPKPRPDKQVKIVPDKRVRIN